MSSFTSLTYIPPQNESGKMEYNIQLNNVFSNQGNGEKDVKITFPKMSFSTDTGTDKRIFAKWQNPGSGDGKLSLGLGIYTNGFYGFPQTMYYFDVAAIPNAKQTQDGAYFNLEDSLFAFNDALERLLNEINSLNRTTFQSEPTKLQPEGYKIYAQIPTYKARIENNQFIIESNYAFPIVDEQWRIDKPNIPDLILSTQAPWQTTNVLPPECIMAEDNERSVIDGFLCVGRGFQKTVNEQQSMDISKLEVYAVIMPNGEYFLNELGKLSYFFTATPDLAQAYSFLPWVDSIDPLLLGVKRLDQSKCVCKISEEPPLVSSVGRSTNYFLKSVGADGFYYIETKKHYFSFPLVPYKSVEIYVGDPTDYAVHKVYIPDDTTTQNLLQNIRFIHISYENAFFVPSYFVRGTSGGNQQLVNTNIIYTFDRFKDASMFETGQFYFDENSVRDMPYILTKLKNMSAYDAVIRVYAEDYNGNFSVLNGSNFSIQMKFQYD